MEFQRTGNEKRDKVREKLIEALGRDGTAEAAVVRTRAQEIEEAMFEQVRWRGPRVFHNHFLPVKSPLPVRSAASSLKANSTHLA